MDCYSGHISVLYVVFYTLAQATVITRKPADTIREFPLCTHPSYYVSCKEHLLKNLILNYYKAVEHTHHLNYKHNCEHKQIPMKSNVILNFCGENMT